MRKYLQTTSLTEDKCLENRKNTQNTTVKKSPIRKWTKDVNRHFTEEYI